MITLHGKDQTITLTTFDQRCDENIDMTVRASFKNRKIGQKDVLSLKSRLISKFYILLEISNHTR